MTVHKFIILSLLYQCNFIYLNSLATRSFGRLLRTYYNLDYAKELFEDFKEKYRKEYRDPAENNRRFRIFVENVKMINDMNSESPTATFGITEFADETQFEFWDKHTGIDEDSMPSNETGRRLRHKLSSAPIPDSWDWRDYGLVDRIRHQGDCGSCWSFSAAGVVFGQLAKYQNKRITLSTQQMVDCYVQGGGCRSGSFPHMAFRYAAKIGGYMSEEAYPYRGVQGVCKFRREKAVVRLKGGQMLKIKDEEELKRLVYSYGPVSIGLHTSMGFAFYTGGLATQDMLKCNSTNKINHAVLLVGYGIASDYYNRAPYWIIQNSAGEQWGDQGFIQLVRGQNLCNILTYVATAQLA